MVLTRSTWLSQPPGSLQVTSAAPSWFLGVLSASVQALDFNTTHSFIVDIGHFTELKMKIDLVVFPAALFTKAQLTQLSHFCSFSVLN